MIDKNIKLLYALSNETRIEILQYLLNRELCACSIHPFIGKAQSTISGHLKILEEAGIIESKRVGVNIWYRIKSKKAIQIMKILGIQKIENKINC
ncbi:MAG: metalloregulator ArsR/SmtB family transcription factor [Candidatus Pacearchaeota archaeon]